MKKIIILLIAILIAVGIYIKIDNKIQYYDTDIVILDAGHGDSDTGAVSGNIYEKNINLKAAKLIGKELEKAGITVIYTRDNDKRLSSDKNTDLKLRAQMSSKYQAEYFVSVHTNYYENVTSGFEIFINDSRHAEKLAESIGKEFNKLNYSENRGIKDGSHLRVLRLNEVPSILVELGFINGKDINYLIDDNKLEKLCQSISKGIMERVK